MPLADFRANEAKWQSYWKENRTFNPEIDGKREPFYIQVAYPYPSGAMHIGHARTYSITDIVAKYQRLKGKNVLMPMGWHVSGTPVIASVEALNENRKDAIEKFNKNFRIPLKDIEKLKTPTGFVQYMVQEAEFGYKKGFNILGLGIDWRRELTTIDPQYNKFVIWQYGKLEKKGYLKKGKYPVRFCPYHKDPVGDHDLTDGQGVGINEFAVLKFRFGENRFLLAATLRPETIFGQTNLWINPEFELEEFHDGKDSLIASGDFFRKYEFQHRKLELKGKIGPKTLIGKMVIAPGIEKEIPILPASFVLPNYGSGIVHSVPSDSPPDYIALMEDR